MSSDHQLQLMERKQNINNFLNELTSRWYCYWDNSYTTPSNSNIDYIFKLPLVCDNLGVITTDNFTVDEENTNVADILCIYQNLIDNNIRCSAYGSESDYEYFPFVFYYDESTNGDFTPYNVLKFLGAHDNIVNSIQIKLIDEIISKQLFGERSESVYNTLISISDNNLSGCLLFHCGSEQMNPVLLFILSYCSQSKVVSGFISGIIHT